MVDVERSPREAGEFIRECVILAEEGDDTFLDIRSHFRYRMRERGLFWTDVVTVLMNPARIENRGFDDEHRQQFWLYGRVPNTGEIRIVCSIDWDTRLITLNWDEP
jgi:hypothetical protein